MAVATQWTTHRPDSPTAIRSSLVLNVGVLLMAAGI